MFKKIGFLIFVSALISCSEARQLKVPDAKTTDQTEIERKHTNEIVTEITDQTPAQPYTSFLDRVEKSDKSAANLFNYLDQDMPAYWDDTSWDFNGVSRVPGEGEIACGYFVTTLLKDLGFDIDRIRLAQEPSGVMIEELTVKIRKSNSLDQTLETIRSGPKDSIYIIGLDFHTGFISHSNKGTFFIHSDYNNRRGVVREEAATSLALSQSNFFMIGSLTENQDLIKDWSKPARP